MHSQQFLWLLAILFANYLMRCHGDDSPGFFLRITKNIPRLGRQTDQQTDIYDFYEKSQNIKANGKNIDTLNNWLSNELKLKRIKRAVLNGPNILTAEHELSIVQPINANANTLAELIDHQAIPNDNVKFIHWKDFDLALQLDNELYAKIMLLGRRPDQRLKEDLTIGAYASSTSSSSHIQNPFKDAAMKIRNYNSYNNDDAFAQLHQLQRNNIY